RFVNLHAITEGLRGLGQHAAQLAATENTNRFTRRNHGKPAARRDPGPRSKLFRRSKGTRIPLSQVSGISTICEICVICGSPIGCGSSDYAEGRRFQGSSASSTLAV